MTVGSPPRPFRIPRPIIRAAGPVAKRAGKLSAAPLPGLAAWIEANIILPDNGAAPGPMKLWPWQVEIADAMTDPALERVTMHEGDTAGL